MDVKLKRNPWTGQMVYADSSTPLGCVTAAAQRSGVVAAAMGPRGCKQMGKILDTLYTQLFALYDSVRGLHVRDVQRLVNAAWGPVEDQMRVQGVTDNDIVAALGRHAECITTLYKTIRVLRSERAEKNSEATAVAVVEQRVRPRLSIEAAGGQQQSTVGEQQRTRKQKETQRKRERKKQKKAAARGEEIRGEGVQQATKDSWGQSEGLGAAAVAEAEKQAELLRMLANTLLEPTAPKSGEIIGNTLLEPTSTAGEQQAASEQQAANEEMQAASEQQAANEEMQQAASEQQAANEEM
jgi:hypothetical protein